MFTHFIIIIRAYYKNLKYWISFIVARVWLPYKKKKDQRKKGPNVGFLFLESLVVTSTVGVNFLSNDCPYIYHSLELFVFSNFLWNNRVDLQVKNTVSCISLAWIICCNLKNTDVNFLLHDWTCFFCVLMLFFCWKDCSIASLSASRITVNVKLIAFDVEWTIDRD